MPSGLMYVALVGQTSMQGGRSQCWHMTGIGVGSRCPAVSTASRLIQDMSRPCEAVSGVENGTLFSCLQATTHAWHPVHRSRSMTRPHLAIGPYPRVTLAGTAPTADRPRGQSRLTS